MSKFINKYEDLRKESVEYIINFLKENGGRFEFASQEEIESENFSDTSWDYPQATLIGRNEYTYYFTITSITLEKGKLWFNGICINEDSEEYNFGETEVDVACLCDCADLLTIKE